MKKLKFLIGRIFEIDYRQLFDTVKKVHKISGKNSIALFFDIIYCGFRYQAGYIDYLNARMDRLNKEERLDVVTRGVNNQYVVKYNDFDYVHYFLNKADFNEKFGKFLGRDWLLVEGEDQRSQFADFIKGKDDFILKPTDGTHGDGVAKLPAEMASFDASMDNCPYLAEERIIQVDEMASLNPSSVNTIRAITFLDKEGKANLLAAYMRIGRGGIVDNFCNGGMLTPVDLETGTLMYPAVDGENVAYETHPVTHKSIVGFKIPQWEKVKAMALEAALVVPQVRYVGWDIGISEKGPCLIEGNEYPGHVFYVFAEHHPDKKGCRHVFESVMD